jgi:hypothetical protein
VGPVRAAPTACKQQPNLIGKTGIPQPGGDISNVDGESSYVRVQVLTNAGALDRDKQIAVVSQFTSMIADTAHDPALVGRTWVLLTEAVPGGWGLCGHANTNDELVTAARNEIAELQRGR